MSTDTEIVPGRAAHDAWWDAVPPGRRHPDYAAYEDESAEDRSAWDAAAHAGSETVRRLLGAQLQSASRAIEQLTREHAGLLEEIFAEADEAEYGGDGAAEALAVRYVRRLEAERDEAREQLDGLRDHIAILALGMDTSARATAPSKKSEIEAGCASALRGLLRIDGESGEDTRQRLDRERDEDPLRGALAVAVAERNQLRIRADRVRGLASEWADTHGSDNERIQVRAITARAILQVLGNEQVGGTLGTTGSPASTALTVQDDATCGSVVVVDEDDAYPCGAPSRYLVERSDGDKSYGEHGGSAEACEQHLAETVDGMADGDETVQAVVTIRWDEP